LKKAFKVTKSITVLQESKLTTPINARTYSIALCLGGVLIICFSMYAYEFGQRASTALLAVGLLIGLCLTLASILVCYWEREKYYEDSKWHGH
jgi:hypothetical protein